MQLIDKDILLEQMKRRKEFVGRPSDPVCLVEDAQIVDAVPVVRCKDCKWSKPATNGKGQNGYSCTENDNPAYEAFWWLTPDWFCADGERKSE